MACGMPTMPYKALNCCCFALGLHFRDKEQAVFTEDICHNVLSRLEFQQGQPGEEVLLTLELKLLADFGFVGAPNVGKSTLLKALTNAKPKVRCHLRTLPFVHTPTYAAEQSSHQVHVLQIANYPFTTLQPQLGIMEIDQKQIVLADIPGLIPGASQNRGRGFAFLRHVERTRMLAYVLDLSPGVVLGNGRTLLQQLSELQVGSYCAQCHSPYMQTLCNGGSTEAVVSCRLKCNRILPICHRKKPSLWVTRLTYWTKGAAADWWLR